MMGQTAFSVGAALLAWLLLRSGRVPRWLAIWGLIAAPMMLVAGLLLPFTGDPNSAAATLLYAPMAVQEMVFAVWLIGWGFRPPTTSMPMIEERSASDARHHVLILGATGRTGGRVLTQLLDRGVAVRAIVRPPPAGQRRSRPLKQTLPPVRMRPRQRPPRWLPHWDSAELEDHVQPVADRLTLHNQPIPPHPEVVDKGQVETNLPDAGNVPRPNRCEPRHLHPRPRLAVTGGDAGPPPTTRSGAHRTLVTNPNHQSPVPEPSALAHVTDPNRPRHALSRRDPVNPPSVWAVASPVANQLRALWLTAGRATSSALWNGRLGGHRIPPRVVVVPDLDRAGAGSAATRRSPRSGPHE